MLTASEGTKPNTHSNVRIWILRARTDSDVATIGAITDAGFPVDFISKPAPRFYNAFKVVKIK